MKIIKYLIKMYYSKLQNDLQPRFKPTKDEIGMELRKKFNKIRVYSFKIHLNGEITIGHIRFTPYIWKIIIKLNKLESYFPFIDKNETIIMKKQFKICNSYLTSTLKLQNL